MKEVWKPIPVDGLRSMYEISNFGRLRSKDKEISQKNRYGLMSRVIPGRMLKTHIDSAGYEVVCLHVMGRHHNLKIHRLVAMAFIPNPENLPCVDHLDTNRDNNVVENLRWCTHKENSLNPITRQHLTNALIGNTRAKGKPFSEEHRRRLSKAGLGRSCPQETREKIRKTLTGRKFTEERRLKCCKTIGQYSLEGELIKIWPSGTDAARELGLGWSNILSCANPNKKNQSAGGFLWKYIQNKA